MSLRHLPYLAAILVGAALATVLLAVGQLGAARAADEVVTGASPFVTERGVAQMRTDLDRLSQVDTALRGPGTETLARLRGQSPDAFTAELAVRYPDQAAATAALPEIAALADKVIGNLERHVDEFESAAALPGAGLSLHQAVVANSCWPVSWSRSEALA